MISDVLALLAFFNKMKSEAAIKVAHFDGNGQKISGDVDVNVTAHRTPDGAMSFFEVNPLDGYTFLRFPVNPGGVVEDLGVVAGKQVATHFRYVASSVVSTGGQQNVFVPFIVYGYKTKALIELGSPVGP